MQVTKHHLRYYLLWGGFPATQPGSLKTGSHPAWHPQPCSLPNTWQEGIIYCLSNILPWNVLLSLP